MRYDIAECTYVVSHSCNTANTDTYYGTPSSPEESFYHEAIHTPEGKSVEPYLAHVYGCIYRVCTE